MEPVTVVTGANSGIGRATAVHLATKGHTVYGTVRSLEKVGKLEGMAADAGATVELVVLDVADDDSVRQGFAEIIERAGRVDNLVNNAGIAGNAVLEECPVDRYAEVMNVNLYGTIRCIQAVLPQMRARRSGCIVNISSITGRIAALAQQPYVASKWALEGMSEGLAQEVAPYGIRVALIEPGLARSAIVAKNTDAPNESGAYDAAYRRLFQFYAAGLPHAADPFDVAAVIEHAITTDQPQLRYWVAWAADELLAGRAAMSDNDWVALGALDDDDAYYDAFQRHFGLDIHPAAGA
jgi:NAD(P)-dependent dehydrogenase (short-subunit alcohol dehydrogenase family)